MAICQGTISDVVYMHENKKERAYSYNIVDHSTGCERQYSGLEHWMILSSICHFQSHSILRQSKHLGDFENLESLEMSRSIPSVRILRLYKSIYFTVRV
jgi:hypothetical protein